MIPNQERIEVPSSGKQRISQAFLDANSLASAALMPYFTLGYPSLECSLDIIEAIAPFSDLIELGVPFSDPIADGPTIQRSTQVALENGMTTHRCLQMVAELRQERDVTIPILLMGYYNPILAYGETKFVKDAASAGVDGVIIPDLPIEESDAISKQAKKMGIALVYFLTPTSSEPRIRQVVEIAEGFIYLVSVTGVTGARSQLGSATLDLVRRIKGETDVPLAVGFGISSPEQAKSVAEAADGIIFGSALIDAVDHGGVPVQAALEYVMKMGDGLRKMTP